jgi:hypothetical protein
VPRSKRACRVVGWLHYEVDVNGVRSRLLAMRKAGTFWIG